MNCDFSHLNNCVINCYQCEVHKLVITKPNQTLTAINGYHHEDDSSRDVVTLKIIEQIVNFLPSGVSQHFPYLTVLRIWSSGLRSFTQEDVRNMKYLTDLSLSGNFLESLDSDLFNYNPRLIKVDFTRNRIKHVGSNLMRPLRSLSVIDFYHNDCVNDGARYSFEDLKIKLRDTCPPTIAMMFQEIESLSNEIESLEQEVEKREKKIKICEEEKNSHTTLDSLFPSILTEFNWNDV